MISDEIASLLELHGLGSPGVDLFGGEFQEKPDDAISIREYPGEAPLHVKDQKSPVLEMPRFQVLSRSKSYFTARRKAEEVYRILSGFSGVIGNTGYGRITALQSPFDLGQRDEAGRAYVVCNYQAMKGLSPVA